MKKLTLRSKFLLPILGLSLLLTFSLCNAPESKTKSEPEPEPELATTPAPSLGAPNEDGRPDFKDFDFNSIEGFHQASWAYFRWLTDTVDTATGKLRFETLYNADDIGPNMKKGEGLFLTQSIKDTRAHLMGGIRQADSDGILVDKKGHAVYTSMHIDDKYHDFIQENKLYSVEGMKEVKDTVNFPTGAFSLKIAWKIVGKDEDASNFYVTEADVAKMAYNSQKKIILTDESERRKVAMVGFHIALVVPNHPEMVWATFEHKDNAPDYAGTGVNDAVSDKNYTFYQAGATMTQCNNHPELTLDVDNQTLSPVTNVYRRYTNGNAEKNPSPEIDGLVKKSNQSVKDLNKSNHDDMAKSSVWQNYDELGAIWFNQPDSLKANQSYTSTSSLLIGSLLLSNSVIETFTQTESGRSQCFGCHNTQAVLTGNEETMLEGKNILTSHILVKNYLKQVADK